jgi:hypothetical protein
MAGSITASLARVEAVLKRIADCLAELAAAVPLID